MTKYKYICLRFIIDKNVKIYKKESSNKLYCKNKINTKNGKKICMISLNNYKKKRKKLMLLKHNKKQVAKQSSKKKTRTASQRPKNNKKKGGGLTFKENITHREISALMIDDQTNKELGHFSLKISRPYDLSVSIDDDYQGLGLSKKLLELFYNVITRRHYRTDRNGNNVYVFENGITLNDTDILVIDTDASSNARGVSFWDYIGMKPNRHYDRGNSNRHYESSGYEKTITLKDILIRIYNLTN